MTFLQAGCYNCPAYGKTGPSGSASRGTPEGGNKRLSSETLQERRGRSCAYTNHVGVHGMQAQELQPDQGKEEPSGEDGGQKVLPVLQEAYDAQGNKVIGGLRGK